MFHRLTFFVFLLLLHLILTSKTVLSISPTTIDSNKNSSVDQNKIKGSDFFADQQIIRYLRTLRKGVLTYSNLATESMGIIHEIDIKGGSAIRAGSNDKIQYKIKLSIMGDNRTIAFFYYTKNLLVNTEVVNLVNGTEEQSNLEDLKVGDRVTIQDTFTLIKGPYLIRTKSKIKKI